MGMRLDTLCIRCERLDEDGAHLFFKCKKARQIWKELQLEQVRISLAATASAKIMAEEVIKLKDETLRLVVILMYLWCSERCVVREGERLSSSQLAQIIRTYIEECLVFEKSKPAEAVPHPTKPVWSKPPEGFAKLNYDGAFRDHDLSGGWGFVIQDCEGAVIDLGYGKLQKVLEPLHAELVTVACLQAVQDSREEMGNQKVVLATDVATVIQALSRGCVDRSIASGVIWELEDLIRCNFVSNVVVHNPRSCNLVAHSLAAVGAGLGSGIVSV